MFFFFSSVHIIPIVKSVGKSGNAESESNSLITSASYTHTHKHTGPWGLLLPPHLLTSPPRRRAPPDTIDSRRCVGWAPSAALPAAVGPAGTKTQGAYKRDNSIALRARPVVHLYTTIYAARARRGVPSHPDRSNSNVVLRRRRWFLWDSGPWARIRCLSLTSEPRFNRLWHNYDHWKKNSYKNALRRRAVPVALFLRSPSLPNINIYI